MKTLESCKDFFIEYWESGLKRTLSKRLPVSTGYEMMRRLAANMAPGLMATAVHPEDIKLRNMKEYQIKVIRMDVITVRANISDEAFDYAEDPKNFPPNSDLFDAHLISEEEIKDKPL